MISLSKWKKQEADKCVFIDDALFPLTVISSTCDHDPGSVQGIYIFFMYSVSLLNIVINL